MRRCVRPVLLLLASACGAAPESEAPSPSPVSVSADEDGVRLTVDAATTRQLLGNRAVDACVTSLPSGDEPASCSWTPPGGPSVELSRDGSAQVEIQPGSLLLRGAWTVASSERAFTVGLHQAGTFPTWDQVARPDEVPAETRSVLQITGEAPRAGLLLGSDRVIRGFPPESGAPAAGLREGDLVVALNGRTELARDARTFVDNLPKEPGAVARIGVQRDGETLELALTMQPYWRCHRVWSDSAVPGRVDEKPTGPSAPIECPPWALHLFTAK